MTAKITHVSISKLFGYLDHEVPFPAKSDFIILYGANGVGKTTLLRLLNSLFNARFVELTDTPFSRLRITFDDSSVIEVLQHTESSTESASFLEVSLRTTEDIEGSTYIYRRPRGIHPRLRTWLTNETSWRQIERNLWQDTSDGEVLPESELSEMFDDISRRWAREPEVIAASEQMSPGLESLLRSLVPIFVATDRLSSSERSSRAERYRATQTVAKYANELRAMIRSALTTDARLSQDLDRTFPIRLLDDEIAETPAEQFIRDQYSAQNERRAILGNLGIISGVPEISLPHGPIEPWKLRALALFLHDANERLSSFDSILPKVSLFHDMVNSRFVGKQIRLSDAGLVITIDATGKQIRPTLLSSGEQHELILAYDLIFKTRPGQLILIDEPEISLHAAWQQQFLADMRKVFDLTGSRAIIATHSPQIVDRWTKSMVALTTESHGA